MDARPELMAFGGEETGPQAGNIKTGGVNKISTSLIDDKGRKRHSIPERK